MPHLLDGRMLLEEPGDSERARGMTLHPQVESLEPLQELERRPRGQGSSEIVHEPGLDVDDKGKALLAETVPQHEVAISQLERRSGEWPFSYLCI